MYKKIYYFFFTPILFGLASTTLGMEKKIALKHALYKNLITDFAVNDCIINVSSAYQWLKKEISLLYDVANRTRFNKINNNIASTYNVPIRYQMSIDNDFLDITRDTRFPNFMLGTITYTSSIKDSNQLNAQILIDHYMYNIYNNDISHRAKWYQTKQIDIKNVDLAISDNADNPWALLAYYQIDDVPYDNYVLELISNKRISDWFTVIKNNKKSSKRVPDIKDIDDDSSRIKSIKNSSALVVNNKDIPKKQTNSIEKIQLYVNHYKNLLLIIAIILELYLIS